MGRIRAEENAGQQRRLIHIFLQGIKMNSAHDILRFGQMFGFVTYMVEFGFRMTSTMEPSAREHFLSEQLRTLGSILTEFLAVGKRLGCLREQDIAWLSDWARYLPEMESKVRALDMMCTMFDVPGKTRLETLLIQFVSKWHEFKEEYARRKETEDYRGQHPCGGDSKDGAPHS